MATERIYADQIETGDRVMVKAGTTKRYFRVVEVHAWPHLKEVEYVYKAHGTFVHRKVHADKRLTVKA